MISEHNLEHLSATEHKLYIESAMTAMNGILSADRDITNAMYLETIARTAFDIADSMVAEYRERFEPNER
jgi:hypothetical protein